MAYRLWRGMLDKRGVAHGLSLRRIGNLPRRNRFSARVYETVKKFPSAERFDLTSQARRAANSIVLNIAEGSGRGTKKDFCHFLDMALGSTFETVACFFVARKQSYVSQHDLEEMKRDGESLSKRIHAFKRTLR